MVGQAPRTTTLKNAIKSGKLAHAYLFCGPRGVGKTTCARIFARTINCRNLTADGEACGECESCRSFNEQRSYNIFELDAASNNSVDDIRQLIDQTRIPPQTGRYKVFIIDEVHMLSASAFNAFLKTLEEPPANVIFILATTEKHKLLPTIISRCQIYDFERITVQSIIDYLRMVAEKEGCTYEEEALAVIAEKADGGMRDALSIFDQTASYSRGSITYSKVIEDLNVLDIENYFRIVDLSIENNVTEIMLLLNNVINKGFDPGNVCQGLARHLRNVMMAKDARTTRLLEVSARQKEHYAEQAQRCTPNFLYTALKILNACDISYRQSSNKRLLVELSLIQIAQITMEGDTPLAGNTPGNKLKPVFGKDTPPARTADAIPQETGKTADGTAVKREEKAPVPPVDKAAVQAETIKRAGNPSKKLSNIGYTFAGDGVEEDGGNAASAEAASENGTGNKTAVFDEEKLQTAWLAMCNRMMLSPETKGLALRLKNLHPVLTEFPAAEVVAENGMLLDEIKKTERDILSALRQQLANSALTVSFRLAALQEVKPAVSKAEKAEEMKKSNPGVGLLLNSIDLEIS